ncbi:MAG: DUF4126 domain-containing protein [Ignavibacteriae bacterium]|nr:MAG: DUF4126 domain-containing protein [Ignavibacteriota bacterium]
MEYVIGIFLGIGLAASSGFRVFVPLLIVNIASLAGMVNLTSGFEWMGSWSAFAVFLTATTAEIGAYYIPVIDNALDTIAIPLAAISGTLLSIAFMTDFPPMVRWTLGIIVGGGGAAIIKTGSSIVRLKSTAFTAGYANWIVATFEHIVSAVLSVLTILIPIVTGFASVLLIGYFSFRLSKKLRTHR